MEALGEEPWVEAANVNGGSYAKSLVFMVDSADGSVTEYDLSRDWARLKATVGVRDDAPSDASARFEVFGDGRRLYRAEFGLGQSGTVDVDVTGMLRLRIETTWQAGDGAYAAVWGDALVAPQ